VEVQALAAPVAAGKHGWREFAADLRAATEIDGATAPVHPVRQSTGIADWGDRSDMRGVQAGGC